MWKKYFQTISDVCPWSWEAYQQDKILITEFKELLPLGTNQAIVYTFDDIEIESLDDIVYIFNEDYPEYEFLWSHPDHSKGGQNQTPVPVIIQQDRKLLESLRKGKTNVDSKAKETSKSSS